MEFDRKIATVENWRWEFFTPEEVSCKCGCKTLPTEFLLDKSTELRRIIKARLSGSSWARCEKHNKAIGGSKILQPHVQGLAVDYRCYGKHLDSILKGLISLGVKGLGFSQKNGSPMEIRYLHADWVDRGVDYITIWSY